MFGSGSSGLWYNLSLRSMVRTRALRCFMPVPGSAHRLRILPSGRTIECLPSESLLHAMRRAGEYVDASCGGRGSCRRCRCRILKGETSDCGNPGSAARDVKLACMTAAESDLAIENLSSFLLKPAAASKEGDYPGGPVSAAVDLGTTIIKAELAPAESADSYFRAVMVNPQGSYGSDVLSRLEAARSAGGRKALRELAVSGVANLLDFALRMSGTPPGSVAGCAIAGNAAMTALMLGEDASGLAVAPHRSGLEGRGFLDAPAAEIGLAGARAFFLPVLGGFVGGDTTAGILSLSLDRDRGARLFLDLGTNGEIVLSAKGRLTAASAAAGPAFEGGRITSGMPALPGAVCKVRVSGRGIEMDVLGGGEPRGFCGSGLLELAAAMLDLGALGSDGLIGSGQPGVTVIDGAAAYAPNPALPGLMLTQNDVREIQLAAGAVRAGIEVLLKSAGNPRLDEAVLTGSFGQGLDLGAASRIGLIPATARRASVSEDCALRGAMACATDPAAARRAAAIADAVECVSLATGEFEEAFYRNLRFPQE